MIDYILAKVNELALAASVVDVTLQGSGWGARKDLRALPTGYQWFYETGADGVTAKCHMVMPHLGCLLCFACWSWNHHQGGL